MAPMLAHVPLATVLPSMDLTAKVYKVLNHWFITLIFLLHDNNIDDDECALGTAACNQECTNTPGSYTCSCFEGYVLDDDQHICIGMHVYKS